MISKRVTTVVSLMVTVVFVMAVGASSALAESHPFLGPLGGSSSPDTFTNPNGIAVDEANGDVYVAAIGTDTVYKFDASGKPVDFSALGGNALTGLSTPAGSFAFPDASDTPAALAVDNSTNPADPSRGDLYVMDVGHMVIDKFAPSGAYLGQITGPTPGLFSEMQGVGVDSNGNLLVDVGSGPTADEFDNSMANLFVSAVGRSSLGTQAGFALSPARDAYKLVAGCHCVDKFAAAGEWLGQVDDGSAGVALAVDPATGHVYIDEQSSVAEWDTGEIKNYLKGQPTKEVSRGALVSEFSEAGLAGSSGEGGIAVSGATGDIYVSNPADGEVYVFGASDPDVAVQASTSVTQTTATLNGTVDSNGTAIGSCEFEYGPTGKEYGSGGAYGNSVSCLQTPAQIGAGTAPVPVSADVEGLRPGALYRFRLKASGAAGASFSTGLLATTGPGFGIDSFEVAFANRDGTPDTQAGSHPYEMSIEIGFNTDFNAEDLFQPDGNFKDLIVNLPPGLVGDPSATVRCPIAELDAGTLESTEGEILCPGASQVGELTVEFGAHQGPFTEPVYNIVPPPGVAVELGGHFIIPNALIDGGVPAGGDYGVRNTVTDATALVPVIRTRLVIWGMPQEASHDEERECPQDQGGGGCPDSEPLKPFLTLPTGCSGPMVSTVSADSYEEPGRFVSGPPSVSHDSAGVPVSVTGCSKLDFKPTITVAPDVPDASSSTGLTVGVHVSQLAGLNPNGLAESTLRDTTVMLPHGVAINPAGADGLEACSEGLAGFTGFTEFNPEFEPGDATATFSSTLPERLQPGVSFCPNGSKIGTVKIKTPLLPNPLEGAVYLATQNENPFGSLVAMYLIAEDPVSGSAIKLAGHVSLCENTGEVIDGDTCEGPGQVVATFDNTPELPFEELELHFFGGERAPLTTPSRCGTYTTQATFTPWDGNGAVHTTVPFQITSGPDGAPCPGAGLPFDPSLTAGMTSIQAGGFSPFTMTMSREDGQQNLQAISLNMPPGLSGELGGAKLCGEAEANAGTCGPESEIGETVVSVGVGNDPFTVRGGKVYITGPYKGAPFGLSIVNPAVAGPYNLGKVIVRAKIEVNPITAALTITSDNEGPYKIPQYIDGIPLQIKHVNVTITRKDFTFNPTNCNKMAITGSLDSTEGSTDALSVPFQATNCATLGFAPKFAVSTSGKTSRADGASLSVKLTYPNAPFGSQANIARVKVELPKQLPSRLTTLQKACTAAQFQANPAGCPAASVIGHAKAVTPLVPVPLEGPAYFVSHGGEAFPSLIVVLQGYGVTIDLVGSTFINGKTGVTSSTFKTVPDAPVGSFELTLPEGKYSALSANVNLCTSKLTMPTEFVAQNGAEIHQSTPIRVTGCEKAKTKTLTRAQRLARALKACGKKPKGRRAACDRVARGRFGTKATKGRKK
jgi:hypothetical protein